MTETQLPTPDDRPHADVVIYDGNCRFCTVQVQRLARWDKADRLAFLSLHDAQVAQRYPDLTYDELTQQMCIIAQDGRTFYGAGALRYLTRRLPRLWILAPLLHIPFSLLIWQWIYRQVAGRRYRLGGASDPEDGPCRVRFH